MSVFEHPDSLKLLQDLLKPPDESSDSEDDCVCTSSHKKLGPGDIGPKMKTTKSAPEKDSSENKQLTSISEEKDEVEQWLEKQEKEDSEILESRKVPKYEILYKQTIGTEDIYLQMNNKSAASMSCEDMVIQVELPEESVDVKEMDLAVTEKQIDLKTPVYRLKLPLIHEVDPNKGKAAYDSEKRVLMLTLRMKREFDFVNF